jgi:hypothetical protein
MPPRVQKIAYLAMVRSTLEYGCLIWDPYTNKDIDKLESIEKKYIYDELYFTKWLRDWCPPSHQKII